MDEARLVRFLTEHFPFRYGLGIGDDTSVVQHRADGYQLITKDLFIQDVHFSLDYYTIRETALKALAVNLSDIAAMGGQPLYFFLGLAFPPGTADYVIEDFFLGLEEGCRRWGVQLAGGDYSSAALLMISITMVGRAERPVYRNGAQPGDWIGITGVTGESAIGLRLLQRGVRGGEFPQKHKYAEPQIAKGRVLSRYVNAMMDISDGLLLDLKRLITASGVGGVIDYDRIPVTETMHAACDEHRLHTPRMVLAGGEDYQLLFTVSPQKEKELKKEGIDYYIIGSIDNTPEKLTVLNNGKPMETDFLGYDHFNTENNKQ